MLVALDETKNRIYAKMAEKDMNYFCPMCNRKVILKKGEINIPHFAHKELECSDDWHYDMSDWHKNKQAYFDVKYQEVVVENNGIRHRADILKDGVVIEFQHSSISADEFEKRNQFYTSCGYKFAWIFDVTEQINDNKLYWDDNAQTDNLMRWNYPMRILQMIQDLRISNNVSIWLNWDYDHIDEDSDYIYRIKWSSKNDEGLNDYKRIVVSEPISLVKNMEVKELFYSNHTKIINSLKEKGINYNIKKIGEKGFPRDSYVCPKTKTFGISVYGDSGCDYCQHCYTYDEYMYNKTNVYCCFPNIVSDRKNMHP